MTPRVITRLLQERPAARVGRSSGIRSLSGNIAVGGVVGHRSGRQPTSEFCVRRFRLSSTVVCNPGSAPEDT